MRGYELSELRTYYDNLIELLDRKGPTLAHDVMKIPVKEYTDPDLWQREVEMFRTTPAMLAFSGELPEPGSYLAITRAGVSVVLTRLKTGEVRMFINACRHRGAKVVPDGSGSGPRMTCPYHAWTFGLDGKLLAIAERENFGEVDKNCLGLIALPVEERAGLIWGILTPGVKLDLDEFLGPEMSEAIEKADYGRYRLASRVEMPAANWKLTDEGFRESYHLGPLHPTTLSSFMYPSIMKFEKMGLHTRFYTPALGIRECDPSSIEDLRRNVQIAVTLFPSTEISFASDTAFSSGPEGREPHTRIFSNQVWPGDAPDKSITISRTLIDVEFVGTPLEEEIRNWSANSHNLVRTEDYPMVQTTQDNLRAPGQEYFVIGRNEIGVQHLHESLHEYFGNGPEGDAKQPALSAVG
ncbi:MULTISPECIES: aromatic ring-hydroxylating oxygenase subunit alpha [Sphingobium]|uniref:aromatic ring-hydroxylating oxygenase subunit alpha n=1 Tax=Sphingobium TaxID=165695 RepID=UPI00159CBF08|nr:aromatic ring-hydroxylating dioxygenase subunit alpha [Sphingobium sp. 15-1]